MALKKRHELFPISNIIANRQNFVSEVELDCLTVCEVFFLYSRTSGVEGRPRVCYFVRILKDIGCEMGYVSKTTSSSIIYRMFNSLEPHVSFITTTAVLVILNLFTFLIYFTSSVPRDKVHLFGT